MKCPECNQEMETGYIQGARGVIFSPYEKSVFIMKTPFSKKDKKITGQFFELSSPAFYCYACDCLVWKKEKFPESAE